MQTDPLAHLTQELVDSICCSVSLAPYKKGQAHLNTMYALVRKIKYEYDNGVKYPLEKSQFILQNDYEFDSDRVSISFDNVHKEQKTSNRIRRLHFSIDKRSLYTVMIFFDEKDRISQNKLQEYLKKNGINSIEPTADFKSLKIFYTRDKAEFLSCLRLLMPANEFDDNAQEMLQKLLNHVDK